MSESFSHHHIPREGLKTRPDAAVMVERWKIRVKKPHWTCSSWGVPKIRSMSVNFEVILINISLNNCQWPMLGLLLSRVWAFIALTLNRIRFYHNGRLEVQHLQLNIFHLDPFPPYLNGVLQLRIDTYSPDSLSRPDLSCIYNGCELKCKKYMKHQLRLSWSLLESTRLSFKMPIRMR